MRIKKILLEAIFLTLIFSSVLASGKKDFRTEKIFLWQGVGGMQSELSLMTAFFPDNPNGTSVIICPGESYHHLGVENEGNTTARWFCKKGVTAFVLEYRTAKDGYHYPAMMQDLQRAIQIVREKSELWDLSKDRLGLIGFSAGGHLVAWQAEHSQDTDCLTPLGITVTESLTPNFVIPVYPVVSMQDDIAHRWSRKSLLGSAPTQDKKDSFSLELTVPDKMPPIYLVACHNDPVVLFENSERLYAALKSKNIDCTFAQYEWGGHGFGMSENRFMKAFKWNEALELWLIQKGFLSDGV